MQGWIQVNDGAKELAKTGFKLSASVLHKRIRFKCVPKCLGALRSPSLYIAVDFAAMELSILPTMTRKQFKGPSIFVSTPCARQSLMFSNVLLGGISISRRLAILCSPSWACNGDNHIDTFSSLVCSLTSGLLQRCPHSHKNQIADVFRTYLVEFPTVVFNNLFCSQFFPFFFRFVCMISPPPQRRQTAEAKEIAECSTS